MTQQEKIELLIKQNEGLTKQLKTQNKPDQPRDYHNTTDTNYHKSSVGELFVDAVTFGAGFSIGDNIVDSIFG